MRQWRMESAEDIDEKVLLEYLEEAIQNQKDGKEVAPEKKPLVIPDELQKTLSENSRIEDGV